MRIALLEDDQEQAELMLKWLADAGHTCSHYDNGRDFLRKALRESYDLLMLDWMLPEMSGLEVLQKIRQSGKNFTPVIFITAKDQESDIVRALEAGADDYMAKPIRYKELVARVAALARRAAGGREPDELPDTEPYKFDLKRKTVGLGDDEVELTHREFDLALFMFRNSGRVVSRSHILESIWGMHGADLNTRTVDTHISRLRKKLQLNESNGWQLSAIYQHGYRLERLGESPA
ncbi:MAG: response regulator transcription factor [Gammaproteobacteria bacterium]|nr:response regulator transcription factor [Gammaproteobacteria bacterium]NNF62065.1 response regulator transcription factor [Gammaproteobacteria bacterium]NNM20676.1 response regulator transcription factor [Gammaproteobacteria bacterium]